MLPSTCIPIDWKGFLRIDGNKSELSSFLGKKVIIEKSNNFSYLMLTDIFFKSMFFVFILAGGIHDCF